VGRIRYYRNPMGLPDTSPTPKKDSMGMDYLPSMRANRTTIRRLRSAPASFKRQVVQTEAAERAL